MATVCVYCASSSKVKTSYFKAAEELGKIFATNGVKLVYGGGNMGLMGALADSVMNAGGKVTGVIPRFMCEAEWNHTELDELILVETMHERKQKMAMMSDAAVALPGGCGTLEELLEVITWKQLGLFTRPIIILNTDGYFDPLLEMLDKAAAENFMREKHLGMWQVVENPEEVLPAIATAPHWDKNERKFAAI